MAADVVAAGGGAVVVVADGVVAVEVAAAVVACGVVFFADVPPFVGPWTVTNVPIGVFGQRAWAVASCISTQPLLWGNP